MVRSFKRKPIDVIKTIRNSFPSATFVYTNGGCYEFYRILKSVFPQAEPYYSHSEGHVYTEIDGIFYDIKGVYHGKKENLSSIRKDKKIARQAPRWIGRTNFKVVTILNG